MPDPTKPLGAVSDTAGYMVSELDPASRSLTEILWENFRILRKHRGAVILAGFLGFLFALLYTLPKPPVFSASAAIEIQPTNDDFLFARDVNVTNNAGSQFPDYDMATQIRVLRTDSLLDRVVNRLKADTSLQVRIPSDQWAEWRRALRLPARRATARNAVIEATAATLRVDSSRGSRVIEIECKSTDPNLAAVFLNTLADEYIEQTIERRWQAAQHTGVWLERQLDDIKIKLEKSEDQLQSYATASNLVFTGDDKDKTNVADQKMSELQRELSNAQADRIVKQARYEMVSSGRTDSMGQVLDDSSLRAFDQKMADLRRDLAEEEQTFGPNHPRVRKLQAQIAQTEADRRKTLDRIVERIHNDYQEAERREKLLNADYQTQSAVLSDQAGKVTHYSILKREVDINRQLYESLLQKVKESGINAALRASNIQVIDTATPPLEPSGPNLRMAALMGLFLGLTGGIGVVSVRERLSTFLVAPGDASFHLGLPELGLIPSYSIDRRRIRNLALPAGSASSGNVPAVLPPGAQSLSTEAYRALLTSILYAGRTRRAQVLIVASPGPGEGKSTITANLALAFAESNRTVLLIDCDTRKPKLHHLFGVANDTGLLELLARKAPLDGPGIFEGLQSSRFPGISMLTAGQEIPGAQTLLHSRRMTELIQLARSEFDVVLIDTPPVMHLADARIIGTLADGVVLVVRSGQTTREAAKSVKMRLDEDGLPVLGVVLNDWNPKAAGYYGYENYAQYYKSYYQKEN